MTRPPPLQRALLAIGLGLALGACSQPATPEGAAAGVEAGADKASALKSPANKDGFAMAAGPDAGATAATGPVPEMPSPGTASAGGPGPEAQAMPISGGSQRIALIDHNGFGRPMPAVTYEIPAGWQARGGATWDPQAPCGTGSPRFQWQATSPDGRQAIEVLPSEAWMQDNLNLGIQGPCPNWPISDVRGYLQSWVQRHRPGARLLDFRPRPDLIRFPMPASNDPGNRSWKEAGEALVAYNGEGGEVREAIAFVVQFQLTTMQGVGPGDIRRFLSGFSLPGLAVRAPAGQLDTALLTRVSLSARTEPEWQARMDQHNTALARQGVRGQAARGAIIAETSRAVADINQRGWDASQASSDRAHRATIDGINNVQRYDDPAAGGEVQLDNRYDNAWRTADGNYIQSNDPNLDPSADLGVEAEQLERTE